MYILPRGPLHTMGPLIKCNNAGVSLKSLLFQFILGFSGVCSITKLICNELPQTNCDLVNLEPLGP